MGKIKFNKRLIGGISGIILGGWMIFYLKDNFGFIPAVMGMLLLTWRK